MSYQTKIFHIGRQTSFQLPQSKITEVMQQERTMELAGQAATIVLQGVSLPYDRKNGLYDPL